MENYKKKPAEVSSSSTSLTPSMAKSNIRDNGSNIVSAENVRGIILDAVNKQMYNSAIFFAERLLRLPGADLRDNILFANCFLLSGEPRRCLATLEHKGLLSTDIMMKLSQILNPEPLLQLESKSCVQRNQLLTHYQLQSYLSAIQMAAHCLFQLNLIDDCYALIEPLLFLEDDITANAAVRHALLQIPYEFHEINTLAGIYNIAGKCLHYLDNRMRSTRAFYSCLRMDIGITEAVDYATSHSLVNRNDKRNWLKEVMEQCLKNSSKSWLFSYYRFLLEDSAPGNGESNCSINNDVFRSDVVPFCAFCGNSGPGGQCICFTEAELTSGELNLIQTSNSIAIDTTAMIRRAENLFTNGYVEDAYRLARQAYSMDPYLERGLIVYVGSMVELALKTELYYLGNELVTTYPKKALSWYTVGCYYLCCGNTPNKLELALKYLQKTTKIDKRFAYGWIALGHVLAAQEESDHAIASYRNACKLLPGDHRPLLYMSKEMIRTGNFVLALHVLNNAEELKPNDPLLLNEMGIVLLHLSREEEATKMFTKASELITYSQREGKRSTGANRERSKYFLEIHSNLATCYRRQGRLQEALKLYDVCLSVDPNDVVTISHYAFTLHLSQRFEEAITAYHRALSLCEMNGNESINKSNPSKTGGRNSSCGPESACVELLEKALKDWEHQIALSGLEDTRGNGGMTATGVTLESELFHIDDASGRLFDATTLDEPWNEESFLPIDSNFRDDQSFGAVVDHSAGEFIQSSSPLGAHDAGMKIGIDTSNQSSHHLLWQRATVNQSPIDLEQDIEDIDRCSYVSAERGTDTISYRRDKDNHGNHQAAPKANSQSTVNVIPPTYTTSATSRGTGRNSLWRNAEEELLRSTTATRSTLSTTANSRGGIIFPGGRDPRSRTSSGGSVSYVSSTGSHNDVQSSASMTIQSDGINTSLDQSLASLPTTPTGAVLLIPHQPYETGGYTIESELDSSNSLMSTDDSFRVMGRVSLDSSTFFSDDDNR